MLKIFRKKPLKAINVGTVKGLLRDSSFSTPMYAKVIEATKCNQTGAELYTLELFFPRIILAEQNTHRVFSRNTGSSRAIPILRMCLSCCVLLLNPCFLEPTKAECNLLRNFQCGSKRFAISCGAVTVCLPT